MARIWAGGHVSGKEVAGRALSLRVDGVGTAGGRGQSGQFRGDASPQALPDWLPEPSVGLGKDRA